MGSLVLLAVYGNLTLVTPVVSVSHPQFSVIVGVSMIGGTSIGQGQTAWQLWRLARRVILFRTLESSSRGFALS